MRQTSTIFSALKRVNHLLWLETTPTKGWLSSKTDAQVVQSTLQRIRLFEVLGHLAKKISILATVTADSITTVEQAQRVLRPYMGVSSTSQGVGSGAT